jgi:hypothetical protein
METPSIFDDEQQPGCFIQPKESEWQTSHILNDTPRHHPQFISLPVLL